MGTPLLDIASWSGGAPIAEYCLGSMNFMLAFDHQLFARAPKMITSFVSDTFNLSNPNPKLRGEGELDYECTDIFQNLEQSIWPSWSQVMLQPLLLMWA